MVAVVNCHLTSNPLSLSNKTITKNYREEYNVVFHLDQKHNQILFKEQFSPWYKKSTTVKNKTIYINGKLHFFFIISIFQCVLSSVMECSLGCSCLSRRCVEFFHSCKTVATLFLASSYMIMWECLWQGVILASSWIYDLYSKCSILFLLLSDWSLWRYYNLTLYVIKLGIYWIFKPGWWQEIIKRQCLFPHRHIWI